jgi:hypothetical protein
MSKTKLTEADKSVLFSSRWALGEALKVLRGQGCPPSASGYIYDALDGITEVLDVEIPTHLDADRLPDTKGGRTQSEKVEEEIPPPGPAPASPIGRLFVAVGHNKGTGSKAYDGADEWTTSKAVADRMTQLAPRYGLQVQVGIRDRRLGYGDAMRRHGNAADVFKANLSIEIHRNAYNAKAEGCEFICVSDKGAAAARIFAATERAVFPEIKTRRDEGILDRREGGNGAGFCRAPGCPALVVEPCFHDFPKDWDQFKDSVDREARMYLAAARASIMHGLQRIPSIEDAVGFVNQAFPEGPLQA